MPNLKNETILILSPQPWDYLYISKHHYARALAENNKVYFLSAPIYRILGNYTKRHISNGLYELNYYILMPDWIKFKAPALYKKMVRYLLIRLLKKLDKIDCCIDFGCYQQFDSMDFIHANYKIFFPVDDFEKMPIHLRGGNLALTVSHKIQHKFPTGLCHYIGHGLSREFADQTRVDLSNNQSWKATDRIRVAYAGNLFIRYLDTEVLRDIIENHPNIEFNFFGKYEFDSTDQKHLDWDAFLKKCTNVILHGIVSPSVLVESYKRMDMFILCYKPDNKNYHGENSHKLIEYFSTGKVVVSSQISAYLGSDLLEMPQSQSNEELIIIFNRVLNRLDWYNSLNKMTRRREFALENTYEKKINYIQQLTN